MIDKNLEIENKRLKEALSKIENPMEYMIKEAEEKEGFELDPYNASLMSDDPSYLKSIARKALKGSAE